MNLLIRALFPTPSSPTTTTLHSHILYSTVTIIILITITNYVCNKCILVTTSVYHLLTPAQPSYDWVSLCGPALPGCLSYRGHNNSDCEHLHHLHPVFRVHLEWDMMIMVLIGKGLRLLCQKGGVYSEDGHEILAPNFIFLVRMTWKVDIVEGLDASLRC